VTLAIQRGAAPRSRDRLVGTPAHRCREWVDRGSTMNAGRAELGTRSWCSPPIVPSLTVSGAIDATDVLSVVKETADSMGSGEAASLHERLELIGGVADLGAAVGHQPANLARTRATTDHDRVRATEIVRHVPDVTARAGSGRCRTASCCRTSGVLSERTRRRGIADRNCRSPRLSNSSNGFYKRGLIVAALLAWFGLKK
jgi:hypothetical protein